MRGRDCLKYDRDAAIIKPQMGDREAVRGQQGELILTSDVGSTRCGPRSSTSSISRAAGSTPAGLGTMGVGLPYALGAKLAFPDRDVACVTGEASILMCIQELSTAKQYAFR